MPCTYTGSLEGDRAMTAEIELDRLERMLCAVCTQLEINIGPPFTEEVLRMAQHHMLPTDANIARWWEGHKAADAKRKGEKP